MTTPVIKAATLVTPDGVPIDTVHLPGPGDLGIVVAHGFTGSWQRPAVWRVATRLNRFGGVVSFDFRGHGRSGGASTMGDQEIKDLEVAVAYARELGYARVVTVGFSMGASIALRHAGLTGGVDAVVAVSSPGHWYYRGTKPMRRVHLGIQHRLGRMMLARFWDTRISGGRWDPDPVPPAEAAALIAPTPLLIVHGDQDAFFPVDHARDLYEAAGEPRELWIIPGFGHAEAGSGPALIDRIGGWLLSAVAAGEPAPSEPAPGDSAPGATASSAPASNAVG
jgi:pimeloyl-ACP methyl ester carboxylesterase